MVSQVFSLYTKYYGDMEHTDAKALQTRRSVDARLKNKMRLQLKHRGLKPDDFHINIVEYQSFEDGDFSQESQAGTMGASYFPEPIFPNSLPVILTACKAYPKEAVS